MVEAQQRGAAAGAAGSDPNAADQNSFHIIHNFFRDRFFKYFEMIQMSSFVIIEESLYDVIQFLLQSKMDEQPPGVKKYGVLTDKVVSTIKFH